MNTYKTSLIISIPEQGILAVSIKYGRGKALSLRKHYSVGSFDTTVMKTIDKILKESKIGITSVDDISTGVGIDKKSLAYKIVKAIHESQSLIRLFVRNIAVF